MRWRVRRRRRAAVFALVLLVAGAGVWLLWPGPDVRAGSVELDEGEVNVAGRRPDSFRVIYRLETHAGDEVAVSTERLWVRRPYEARVEAWTGEPPGRRRTSTTINTFARVRFGSSTFAVAPAPAPQDRRADALLEEADEAGFVEARERRRVAGRVCRILRVAGEGGSGSLERPTEEDELVSEVCLDEAGIALEEVTYDKGRVLTRKVATEVEEEPELRDSLFRAGDPELSVRQGGGSVRELRPDSRPPGTFWELPDGIEGFDRRGRYAVVPPQAGFDDPTQRPGIVTLVTDVWERGLDVILIEQGSTLGGRPPFSEDPNAVEVRAGDLGEGELLHGLRTAEVRFRDGGRFVRVVGTVQSSRLLAIARSLEEMPGGELVYR